MAQKSGLLRPTDDDALALAERLVRSARFGALATLDPATGAPQVTRVATATAADGAPLILVSALSAHTGALGAEPRCSLLLGEPGKGDPLAHPRVTLACLASRLAPGSNEHRHARRRFLNRNPKAQLYVDFPDFALFRLDPQSASLNGGFGKAYALSRSDLLAPAPDDLAAVEQSAIVHMNEDHRDAVVAMARGLARRRGDHWHVTGLDSRGIDLAHGDEIARIAFPAPVTSAADLRQTLATMTRTARDGGR